MNATKLVDEVFAVMNDGTRIDRFLTRNADGGLYLTTKNEAEQQYRVLVDDSGTCTEEDADGIIEQAAEALWVEPEHFDDDFIHTSADGHHYRHGDGAEVDGEGNAK